MIDEALFWEWLRKKSAENQRTLIEEQPQLEIELPKRPPTQDEAENTRIDYSIDDKVIFNLK